LCIHELSPLASNFETFLYNKVRASFPLDAVVVVIVAATV